MRIYIEAVLGIKNIVWTDLGILTPIDGTNIDLIDLGIRILLKWFRDQNIY